MINPNCPNPARGNHEPSYEASAILIRDIEQRRPELTRELEQLRHRVASRDIRSVHPAAQIMYGFLDPVFKASILETVLAMAATKEPTEQLLLPHVAVVVEHQTGFKVWDAAQIPFVYNEALGVYGPDIERLHKEAGPTAMAFTEAYAAIQGYCTGAIPLPEA